RTRRFACSTTTTSMPPTSDATSRSCEAVCSAGIASERSHSCARWRSATREPSRMNLRAGSELLFALGRRYPRLPLAFLRALPLPVLDVVGGLGLRETLRIDAGAVVSGRLRGGARRPTARAAAVGSRRLLPHRRGSQDATRSSPDRAARARHRELRHLG